MVKHIVLFKLKDEVSAEEKLVVMNKFKEAIEALPAKIAVIRKVEVGLNMNPGETWNIALYSDCLLYTSPSPRDRQKSRMPSSA